MKERKKRKPVLFWIVFVLTTLLSAALFELGKNTLWGWALLLLLLGGWVLLRTRALAGTVSTGTRALAGADSRSFLCR